MCLDRRWFRRVSSSLRGGRRWEKKLVSGFIDHRSELSEVRFCGIERDRHALGGEIHRSVLDAIDLL
jgi:hypothetical protein